MKLQGKKSIWPGTETNKVKFKGTELGFQVSSMANSNASGIVSSMASNSVSKPTANLAIQQTAIRLAWNLLVMKPTC